ncbi:MAG TPA: hypothetical protein VGA04_28270 [Streptosporangiaceae bacterium]
MSEHSIAVRDVAALEVARIGGVEETGDPLLPFRFLDELGAEIPAVTEFLHHMLADDASPASLRSYAYELLASSCQVQSPDQSPAVRDRPTQQCRLAPNELTVLTLSKDELDIAVRLQSRRPEDREWRRSLGARSRRLDAGESASIAIALSRSHAFASDDEDAHPVEGTHRHSWAPDQRLVRAARCRRSHRQEEARQTCHVLQTDDLHNLGGPPW